MGRAGCREATCRQHNKTTRTCASTRHNAEDKAKIEETSVEKARNDDPRSHAKLEKSIRKRPKIDFGAILGGLRRSGSFNGRRRTRPRPPKNAPRRARGGSRALLAAPGRLKTRPRTRSDRSWDAPVARGSGDGARSQRRTLARAFGTRILIVFRVSCHSADVRSVP